jgi:DNA-binding CsgD family transcriptional regulator
LKQAEVSQSAQALFEEQRHPFGAFSPSCEAHHPVSIADAVRRCRWIAVDLNASAFGVYSVSPSLERARLTPCFDSDYPAISVATKFMSGNNGEDVVRRSRISTIPCWWSDDGASASAAALATLHTAVKVAPLVPTTSGIAFPVYADRGQCGLVVFLGACIALAPDDLFEIHARCFALFDAVARMRPGESGKLPAISKRELECLKLTANGYTSEAIAGVLKLSVHTANQYLTTAAQKLNAVNRVHAVAKALRLGLLE